MRGAVTTRSWTGRVPGEDGVRDALGWESWTLLCKGYGVSGVRMSCVVRGVLHWARVEFADGPTICLHLAD